MNPIQTLHKATIDKMMFLQKQKRLSDANTGYGITMQLVELEWFKTELESILQKDGAVQTILDDLDRRG